MFPSGSSHAGTRAQKALRVVITLSDSALLSEVTPCNMPFLWEVGGLAMPLPGLTLDRQTRKSVGCTLHLSLPLSGFPLLF